MCSPAHIVAGHWRDGDRPCSAIRHCEERSDEVIQKGHNALDCFAPLAMTGSPSAGQRGSSLRGAWRARHCEPAG
ncbi:MAG: hypothetical protein LBT00_13195 [Spirochaetaceae bacterium]|nr:hypothetical protein [Spirochaetaceae bacterium]